MSNAKRRTLIIAQAILIVAVFLIALIGLKIGEVNIGAQADVVQESIDARNQVENMHIGGTYNEHDAYSYWTSQGKTTVALDNESKIQSFLKGELSAQVGYLTGPITTYSWDGGFFTKQIMAGDKIFDGNGYTINLTAKYINSKEPWASFSDIYNSAVGTYFKAASYHTDLDLCGAFVGYIPPSSSVINTKFVTSTSIHTYQGNYQDGWSLNDGDSNRTSVNTGASGCAGYLAAYCSGTVDNCSITVNENVYLRILKASNASTGAMSRHSFSIGGLVGVLAGPSAVVSNCSVNLKSGSLLYLEINSNKQNNARGYVGGIIGWMGDGSSAYNLYCEGTGTLRGTTSGSDANPYPINFTGIAVGSAGATMDGKTDSDVTGTNNAGTINGVISTWTGTAYFRTRDANFSMTGDSSNSQDYSLQGVIVGCEGAWGDPNFKATNLYFMGDPNYITIGYSYTQAAANNNTTTAGRAVRQYNSVVVKETIETSATTTLALTSPKAQLRFASTAIDSDIWVTYDLSTDTSNLNHIFWAITADKSGGSLAATTVEELYFNKFQKAQEAMSYNFAHVELVRGRYSKVDINVEIGRAMYYKFGGSGTDLGSAVYGTKLSLPSTQFWYDETRSNRSAIELNGNYKYFRTVIAGTTQPIETDGIKDVGQYSSFVYTEKPADGSNYNDIDLLDLDKRVVTYIQDNTDYIKYKENHPDYEYIDPLTGLKDFDSWQPKFTETIYAKTAELNIAKTTDVGWSYRPDGYYVAEYASTAIEFGGSVQEQYLVTAAGDTYVEAELAYYQCDDDFNPVSKVTSIRNIGKYLIVAESLKDANYTFNKDSVNSSLKLEITTRSTMVRMNTTFDYEKVAAGTYKIYLPYNGKEQVIQYASGEKEMTQAEIADAGLAFFFYNVIDADSAMIQFDVMGMHGEEVYNATDVPEDGEDGSYMVKISFADGDAGSNYSLPEYTIFIVEITPVEIAFEKKTEQESIFIYGDITPESDDNRGYFAFALDGDTRIEPTNRYYKIKVGDDWVDYFESPRNVGTYQIIYTIDHAVERNYTDTESTPYVVTILPRPVAYTLSSGSSGDLIAGDYVYGAEYTPGVGDYEDMIAGAFGKYKSTTVNDMNGTGLSTDHGQNTIVGYRYQWIGEYGSGWEFKLLTDMDEIAKLPDKILDAGNYVIYPILLFPMGGGKYAYDGTQAGNYDFTLEYKLFAVQKLTVNIYLDYEFTKEYSKALPEYNGSANDDTDRVWKYADGSNKFLSADDISVLLHFYANADSEVTEEGYKVSFSGCKGLDAYNADGKNKADNYDVHFEGTITMYITALEVQVKIFSSAGKITYGDELPEFSYQVVGDNAFTDFDLEDMESYGDIEYVFYALGGEKIDGVAKNAGSYEVGIVFHNDNYSVTAIRTTITIVPKTVNVSGITTGNVTFTYDGNVHYPEITDITFDGVVEGDDITVAFTFYDHNGNKVENPQNAGNYTAKVEAGVAVLNADGTVNANYVLGDVEGAQAQVVIGKRSVVVQVADGAMFYLDVDSLTAIGDVPYTLEAGDGFVGDDGEYFKLVPVNPEYAKGTHENGVSIQFTYADNYDITIYEGELTVEDNNLADLGKYVTVTFDGEKYEDGSVVYNGSNLYSKFNFVTSDLLSSKLSFVITTDANGNNPTTSVINANTYYMVIVSGDGALNGRLIIPFEVAKAERVISESDISVEVHYNKIVLSSGLDNLQYSVNGGIYMDAVNGVYEFDATPLTNYSIRVRVKSGVDGNYADSNEIVINKVTGIDAGELVDQIAEIKEITFSNVSMFRELISRLDLVSDDDKDLIDYAKIDALNASLAALIAEANSVIAGAQSVAAKSVGRGGSVASTALGLSSAGIGLSAVGLMIGLISAKKRKEEEDTCVNANEKTTAVKSRNLRKTARVIVAIMLITLIAVFALSACKEKTITQEEVLNLASFKTASNEIGRAYEITVYCGADLVYKNINGEVESNDLITPPDFNLSSSGSGFDFNVAYFDNISFITSRTTATFSADIVNVSAFLGRANAENATVTVVVDAVHERLNKIEISYDEGNFSTQIVSTMLY